MPECPACSHTWNSKTGKPRSTPQHRRFFGMVKAAYSNWPVSHEFQPTDPEHLRKWLIAKAGWVDRVVIEPPPSILSEDERAQKLAMLWMEQSITAVRRSEDHTWIRRHAGNIVVFIPRSISFNEMEHQEFGMLNDKVSAILTDVIGLDGDELLQRNKEVA